MKIPGRTAHFGDRAADRVSERPGVESPLDGGRLTEFSGEVGGRGRRGEHGAILLVHEGVDGETDAGIGEVDDRVDALLIHPSPRNRDSDIGLVLMVCENDLDLEAARLLGEVLGRELSANQRPLADLIGERTGEVAQHADLDRVARNLRRSVRGQAGQPRDGERGGQEQPREPCRQKAILLDSVRTQIPDSAGLAFILRWPGRPDKPGSQNRASPMCEGLPEGMRR